MARKPLLRVDPASFLNSRVWEVFSQELESKLAYYRNRLESCTSEELPVLQGQIKQIREFMGFPARYAEKYVQEDE